MARENRSWGYDRIVGALTNVGYRISDQTVGTILKRRSIPPAPERTMTVTWRECIRMHMDVLGASDFFNSAMWSGFGLLISALLCCIHFGRQPVNIVGRIWHQWRHKVHARVLRALPLCAQGQRGVSWIMTCTRSGARRYDTGLQCIMPPTCPSEAERQCLTPALNTAVRLSAARSKQIRDGPRHRRHQRHIFFKDDLRRAA